MRCGLSLGLDGRWGANQLSPELQEIIQKYPNEFAGIEEPDSSRAQAGIFSTDSGNDSFDSESNSPREKSATR
jgi:hypothetical protein